MKTTFHQVGWPKQGTSIKTRYKTTRVYQSEQVPPRRNVDSCLQLEREIAAMSLSGPSVMTDQERAEWVAECRERARRRTVLHMSSNGRVAQ